MDGESNSLKLIKKNGCIIKYRRGLDEEKKAFKDGKLK